MRLSYRDFSEGYIFPEGYIEISVAAQPVCGITVSKDVRGTVYFQMEEKNTPQPRVVKGTVFDAEGKKIDEIQKYILHNNGWFDIPENAIVQGDPKEWHRVAR